MLPLLCARDKRNATKQAARSFPRDVHISETDTLVQNLSENSLRNLPPNLPIRSSLS